MMIELDHEECILIRQALIDLYDMAQQKDEDMLDNLLAKLPVNIDPKWPNS